jgi:hypothetical protein
MGWSTSHRTYNQCFLLEDFALFDAFVKHVQALNASSRAALMLKLDRSGTATRYLLSLS